MTNESYKTNPVKTTKRHRRWFRFRLRTLLVVVTLLSVPLGWVGWELDQRRREKVTIAWVEEMGGQVYFVLNSNVFLGVPPTRPRTLWEKKKDKWFGERVRVVDFYSAPVSDLSPLMELKKLESIGLVKTKVSDLSRLAEVQNLKSLILTDTQVSDLTPLTELKNLEVLGLNNTPVSNLSPLAELKNLEVLFLSHTRVSDLSPLAELKNLKVLHLRFTQASDFSPLPALKNLKTLYLQGSKVSDLSPLAELKNLQYMDLSRTLPGEEQVQELWLALPNCEIFTYR